MRARLAVMLVLVGVAAVLGERAVVALAADGPSAGNIDLSTVPARDTVQLTIYNSEDLTLVRETRKVSFKPGANALQFSWANTLIDPTSVRLRFLTHADSLDVLDTTFPHAKPQMLYWNVQSERDEEAVVEITYFTSGIQWAADYLCIAQPDEANVRLEGFVRVTNQSGEEYENAQVRLVVGKINLVEKIAQLARLAEHEGKKLRVLAKAAAEEELLEVDRKEDKYYDSAPMSSAGGMGGFGGGGRRSGSAKPKEIVKQGLSEYFIYTIEGEETIPNGWSKRMRSFEAAATPLSIEYRYRVVEYGDRLVRMYVLTNDKPSKLGTTPLPDGVVRVFRHNGRDGLSFLAAQPIKYVPIGDKIELNLGQDPEVLFQLVKLATWRDNLWMQQQGADVFARVDEPGFQMELNSTVVGWDDHTRYAQRVRNFTGKPIALEIRRSFPGHVVFRSNLTATSHDFQTVEYKAAVPANTKTDLVYEVLQHQGRNAKQNNVTIEK